jgi:hypothetical protein
LQHFVNPTGKFNSIVVKTLELVYPPFVTYYNLLIEPSFDACSISLNTSFRIRILSRILDFKAVLGVSNQEPRQNN